jgi:hypothetical protein
MHFFPMIVTAESETSIRAIQVIQQHTFWVLPLLPVSLCIPLQHCEGSLL